VREVEPAGLRVSEASESIGPNRTPDPLSEREFRELRRTRRHPRPTQSDYLHIRYLVRDLAASLERVPGPVRDALDIFCGTRPYDDLLPAGARCVGLDVEGNEYGVADVVTDEFLPFPDESFDLVLCTEAFHYVADPVQGVSEIRRVLRPGGSGVISVPLVWQYDRTILEHRYTGPELAALFEGWDDVVVIENGGLAVSWATLTGWMVNIAELHVSRRLRGRRLLHPAFVAAYMAINGVGAFLDRLERRFDRHPYTLPMNLLLTARRPADG
jgi:SAM-dependent methyltransferase